MFFNTLLKNCFTGALTCIGTHDTEVNRRLQRTGTDLTATHISRGAFAVEFWTALGYTASIKAAIGGESGRNRQK